MLVQTAVPPPAEGSSAGLELCSGVGAELLEGSLVRPAAGGMTHPAMELREGTEAGTALHSSCRHQAGFSARQARVSGLGGLVQREQQDSVLL